MKLRDYQEEARDALYRGFNDGGRRLAVVLPTGSGKTVIMAHIAVDAALVGKRACVLVHRDELAQQTLDKLRKLAPDHISIGLVKAEHNECDADIVVASVDTVCRPDRLAQLHQNRGGFAVVIADEIHRSASDSWRKVFEWLGCMDDAVYPSLLCGFTATMSRSDARGLGDIWQKVVYTRGIRWFIERGYLVPPEAKTVVTGMDLDDIKKTAGDYNEKDLGIRMADETIRHAIVDAYQEFASDRQGVLFAPTVASAEFFAAGLNEAGLRTEGVYGVTSLAERGEIYRRYEHGETQVLTSCTALAEGWDAPWASCAVLARPTLHQGLFIQQVGRVLRPWPGKKDALVLDVAGATRLHNLHALIELNETVPQDTDLREIEELPPEDGGGADTKYRGPVAFEDVDLFAGTEAAWMTTLGGVLFVSAGERLVFLHQGPDGWGVGECGKWSMAGGRWVAQGLSPEEALAVGGETIARRSAAWRQGNRRPSEKQIEFAMKLGIDPQGMSKGALSDAITIHVASRALAPIGRKS